MLETEAAQVLSGNEEDLGIFDRADRSRIRTSVENWQLGNGSARSFDSENLLAPVGRAFENAELSRFNNVEAAARVSFGKQKLALAMVLTDKMSGKHSYLIG